MNNWDNWDYVIRYDVHDTAYARGLCQRVQCQTEQVATTNITLEGCLPIHGRSDK